MVFDGREGRGQLIDRELKTPNYTEGERTKQWHFPTVGTVPENWRAGVGGKGVPALSSLASYHLEHPLPDNTRVLPTHAVINM